MSTLTVIILLIFFINHDVNCGFRRYEYSRSVDTSQFNTQSPCPNVFNYQNDENGNLIGAVMIDHTDGDGKVQLDIEMSVGNPVQGYNGKIVLADDRQKVISNIMNGRPIFYRVMFPAWSNIPPKITKISVNGNLICSGPRIPIQMVPVLTIINLQHKLSLGVTHLISSSDPTIDGSPNFNSLNPESPSTQFPIDVREDNVPSATNNVFIDFNPGVNNPFNFNPSRQEPPPRGPPHGPPGPPHHHRPPPGSPGERHPPPPWHGGPPPGPPPDFGHHNPPPGRPPPGPPPGPPPDFNPHHSPPGRPPPGPPPGPPPDFNPRNPFFNGLSTPEPNRDSDIQINNQNPFFNQRTDRPFVIESTTKMPSRERPPTENLNEICGRPIPSNSLIANGQSVPRGAYPWLVAIFRQLDNLSLSYICSGSLISEKHVVTAAHCVKTEYRRVKPSEIVCVFGKLNIRKWVTAPGERILEPDSITVHPDYEPGTANADIAVMTFPDPIPWSKMIMPVCLWRGSNDLTQVVGDIGTVVGWGRDENGDITTAEPRQVNMPIVDHLECLKGGSSAAGQALVEIVSKNTFCAGFRNGSGPCNGDSGSAFLLRKSGIFYLRGVVSTALSESTHRSCNLQEYVVFTDASKYLDWIMGIMKQM